MPLAAFILYGLLYGVIGLLAGIMVGVVGVTFLYMYVVVRLITLGFRLALFGPVAPKPPASPPDRIL